MPRLVRRKPFAERLKAMVNPMDFLLWLSEEMETRDWDSKVAGTQLGLGMNFVFLLARANSGKPSSSDDIFSDDSGTGWVAYFIYPLVWGLVAFSCINAFYAMTRARKYRLFEANVEVKPSTPSARRVKISSPPGTSSPLRYLSDMITPESADSRAHPSKAEDVWELSVWDPLPISLRLFCLFSPGHVLIYLLFLPLAPLDPRPSVTVFNTLLVQVLFSTQLLFLASRFAQQAKDHSIIQKEVMHEYDTKFVHPRVHPVVRDAGTQISEHQPASARELVQTGTPTTLIRRSFHTRQNPHSGSEEGTPLRSTSGNVLSPQMSTPTNPAHRSEAFSPAGRSQSSATRKSLPAGYTSSAASTAAFPSCSTTGNLNFGGNMGIHTHNNSPLKKATSLYDVNELEQPSPRNSREMASYEQGIFARQRRLHDNKLR